MPYYCTKCENWHSSKYYKHLKYKKETKEVDTAMKELDKLAESEPQAYVNAHNIAGIYMDIENIEKRLNKVIEILRLWKTFIDMKHPYRHLYQNIFDDLEDTMF